MRLALFLLLVLSTTSQIWARIVEVMPQKEEVPLFRDSSAKEEICRLPLNEEAFLLKDRGEFVVLKTHSCIGWAKKDLLVKVREIPDDGCDDCVLGMPRENFEEFIQNFNQNSEENN